MISPPEPLIQIQNNFTQMFLIMPSTTIALGSTPLNKIYILLRPRDSPGFMRCLKIFLFLTFIAILIGRMEPFMQILVEGIMGDIHVKLFKMWTSGSGDVVYKEKV